jgi:hypothetical protein
MSASDQAIDVDPETGEIIEPAAAVALVRRAEDAFLPALTNEQAKGRYNALVSFVKTVMRPGTDYGKVPGTDKNTLLKPGAEKICSLFGLAPRFDCVDRLEDWQAGLFFYRYKCSLWRGDVLVAEGEGAANSREKKYRYRTVYPNKATAEDKANGRLETRGGRNGSYQVYVIENTEPFDLVNTLLKMAQKRALVAAALIAGNASEFFTQDVEDMHEIGTEPAPPPAPPVEAVSRPANQRPPLETVCAADVAPSSPERVEAVKRLKALASKAEVSLTAALEAVGKRATSDLSDAELAAWVRKMNRKANPCSTERAAELRDLVNEGRGNIAAILRDYGITRLEQLAADEAETLFAELCN